MYRMRGLVTLFGLLMTWPAYGQLTAMPVNGPATYSGAFFTPIKNGKKESAIWSFGAARSGDRLSHVFDLRNDSSKPLTIDHLQSSCACTSAVVSSSPSRSVAAGATVRIKVTLDTAKIPSGSQLPLLSGAKSTQRIWVYTKGDSVHAAIVLELTGRITSCVSFDPPILDFGSVSAKSGASKLLRVNYDRALFDISETRLTATAASYITIAPAQPPDSGAKSTAKQVVRYYRILIPPGAPAGVLSGVLMVEGLHSRADTASSKAIKIDETANRNLSGAHYTVAYAGEINASVKAEPSIVAFGVVRSTKSPLVGSADPEDVRRRTRWVLLAPAKRSAVPPRAEQATTAANAGSQWNNARVAVTSEYYQVALLSPTALRMAAQYAQNTAGKSHPRSIPEGVSESEVCWLQVVLQADAPRGKPLEATVDVTLEDGERLRLPVMAMRE